MSGVLRQLISGSSLLIILTLNTQNHPLPPLLQINCNTVTQAGELQSYSDTRELVFDNFYMILMLPCLYSIIQFLLLIVVDVDKSFSINTDRGLHHNPLIISVSVSVDESHVP